jgi:hypothetical protein
MPRLLAGTNRQTFGVKGNNFSQIVALPNPSCIHSSGAIAYPADNIKTMAMPFTARSQRGGAWLFVGLASRFPDITESGLVTLSERQHCSTDDSTKQGCGVFAIPNANGDLGETVQIAELSSDGVDASLRRDEQLLVFQYRGKFHAINNVCLPPSVYFAR